MKLNNKYYILRHGEALSNVRHVVSSWPEKFENPLTKRGREMIEESAEFLQKLLVAQDRTLDFIFTSDLLRTKQTVQIVGKEFKIKPKFDKRLREIDFGNISGRPIKDLDSVFEKESERIKKKMPEGESYEDVLKRVFDFLMDIDKKHKNKNILIVSHECPLWILEAKVNGMSIAEALIKVPRDARIHKGQIKELN